MAELPIAPALRAGGSSRRQFLRAGTLGLVGLGLGDWRRLQASGPTAPARARSVIQLWMAGGPPQTDTFDPKPEAGADYCGPFKRPLATNAPGIRIGELLPRLAGQADKYSIIRSLTHGSNAHETAAYLMMTGTRPSPDLAYPAIGSVVALKRGGAPGYQGTLPPYITLTAALGRFSEAGFLGPRYRSFATGGDPSAREFRVDGMSPARGLSQERLQQRWSLLRDMDRLAAETGKARPIQAAEDCQEQAYELILGEGRRAFDLSEETDAARDFYGRTRFGQSCLLARRLVERGVPFVTVNDPGWDTHANHFEAMRQKLPVLDQGFAALLEDLAQRGLLETTIVVWLGEFGRTARIVPDPPWNGGRHHFGQCFSAVVAGGGFRGGHLVGASDARGETVRQRPVYPWDLTASIYKLLGIDPQERLPHPQGCVACVTPLASGTAPSGGFLAEIM